MTGFISALNALERMLIAALMIAMVVLYSISIGVRELLPVYARDFAWVDEATRYMMVWLVFLGLGLALSEGRQIAMTTYLQSFPPRLQMILRKIIDLTGLVFSLYIIWIGIDITMVVAKTGQRSPTLGISAAYLYLALPVGFALLSLRYALSLLGFGDRWSSTPE